MTQLLRQQVVTMKKIILPQWVERICKIMPASGINNPYQLAKAISAPYSTVNSWFKPPEGKLVKRPPEMYIDKLCEVLNCSKEYIYFGDGKVSQKQLLYERLSSKMQKLTIADRAYVETIVDAFLLQQKKKKQSRG